MGGTEQNLGRSSNALDRLTNEAQKNGGALDEVGYTTKQLAKDNKSLALGFDQATGKVNSWSGGIIKTGKSLDDTAEKTEKAIAKSEDYYIQMEKISSNERIKRIEASVSLDIAEAQANADKVIALSETISSNFGESTGLMKDLFGLFSEADNFREKWKLSDQIKNENKIRDEQIKLQKKLTEAEVAYIKQKTRNLAKGDAMIKVNGDGLAPHLEAFMFEILENIQTKVNADGEEMLLGLKD